MAHRPPVHPSTRLLTALGLAGALGALAGSGCGGPKPGEYDEETGLQGIAVRDGALAGTWAQRTVFGTMVTVPILGRRESGGGSTRLVERTWDAQARRYRERFVRCTNDVTETDGTRTIIRDETLARILPGHYESGADHVAGAWQSEDLIDVWGLRGLPDMRTTPLPNSDNFRDAPMRDWVWDEDEDGHPGVTVLMRGTISANLYVIKRNIYAFDGTVLSEDRVQGLVRQSLAESNPLESTVSWLEREGATEPHPDPLVSWFDMVRLPDGAGCDEVRAADADGRLSRTRPF